MKQETGWMLLGTVTHSLGDKYAIWHKIYFEDGIVDLVLFQLTKGDIPVEFGGYYNLYRALSLKGLYLKDVTLC